MFQGGCYATANAPGKTMCTQAANGICSAAAAGYFVPPEADRDATKQSVIPCGSEEEITAGNSHKYKGVANCKVCTPPTTTGSTPNLAVCTTCADGYYGSGNPLSCTVCTDPCATCTASATDKCTSCKEGDTPYFKKGESNDGTATCVSEETCKTDSTHFPTTDANQ